MVLIEREFEGACGWEPGSGIKVEQHVRLKRRAILYQIQLVMNESAGLLFLASQLGCAPVDAAKDGAIP